MANELTYTLAVHCETYLYHITYPKQMHVQCHFQLGQSSDTGAYMQHSGFDCHTTQLRVSNASYMALVFGTCRAFWKNVCQSLSHVTNGLHV